MPHSNGRAEVGVKLTKRILTENAAESGSLDTDALLKVILAYKNAPDESGLSSALVLMGRQLKDAMPVSPRKGNVFDDPNVAQAWRDMWVLADRLC